MFFEEKKVRFLFVCKRLLLIEVYKEKCEEAVTLMVKGCFQCIGENQEVVANALISVFGFLLFFVCLLWREKMKEFVS